MLPAIKLNPVQVAALGGVGVALGIWLKRRIPLLDRLNVPASIAGGMAFAGAITVLHERWVNVEVDTTLRDVLLIASFTTIGLNASLRVLRRGGIQVLYMEVLAAVAAVMQALLGMALARAFGLDARVGILAGTVALSGGPSTSLAFGPVFERAGVTGATTLALASATFGITVAGFLSGWTGGVLIRRRRLKPSRENRAAAVEQERRNHASLLAHVLTIAFAMGLGNLISLAVDQTGFVLPGFVGAMVAAVLVRAVDEATGWIGLDDDTIQQLLAIVLPLFISMAMLTLKLWELAAIALPLLFILLAEVFVTWAFSVFVAFRAMGRDFEAAVMTAGFSGFMLGITPNAVASMEELTAKYGPAPRAYLVVPLVGAFLIDLTNSVVVTALANLWR